MVSALNLKSLISSNSMLLSPLSIYKLLLHSTPMTRESVFENSFLLTKDYSFVLHLYNSKLLYLKYLFFLSFYKHLPFEPRALD